MVATVMEKKRLGLINKACVVVPKHLTLQMASEWLRLYPNAKLLVANLKTLPKPIESVLLQDVLLVTMTP